MRHPAARSAAGGPKEPIEKGFFSEKNSIAKGCSYIISVALLIIFSSAQTFLQIFFWILKSKYSDLEFNLKIYPKTMRKMRENLKNRRNPSHQISENFGKSQNFVLF